MATLSPTQRSIGYFRDLGYNVAMVERWIPNKAHPGGGFRSDLFGFIDALAVGRGEIIAIQSCGQSFREHYVKITQDKASEVHDWLETGAKLCLISWRKVKKVRGGKLMVWKPRIVNITLEDLHNGNPTHRTGDCSGDPELPGHEGPGNQTS